MISKVRESIHEKRVASEQAALLYDVAIWKATLPEHTVIRHHVEQFEVLCKWMFARLVTLYDPLRWNLEQSTFNSLIISVLSGKWVLLRQAAIQRTANSPYLETLEDLDKFAGDCYQRLLYAMQKECQLKDLSTSSPLAYLGPIARLFIFDEEAPCLISAPFGAVNISDSDGQKLCRQTIPHEVSHAIFEQISGLTDELRSKTAFLLAEGDQNIRQKCIHPVLLSWLDEIIADMAGTAVAGLDFARSASTIMIMPDRTVGLANSDHPIALLRPFIHAWTLRKIDSGPSTRSDLIGGFEGFLEQITSAYLDKRFESLPAVVSVTMREVRDELHKLVNLIWKTNLETLNNHSLGAVFNSACKAEVRSIAMQNLPAWGKPQKTEDEFVFRLVGRSNPSSPLPGSPLYLDPICCPMKLQNCCSFPVG